MCLSPFRPSLCFSHHWLSKICLCFLGKRCYMNRIVLRVGFVSENVTEYFCKLDYMWFFFSKYVHIPEWMWTEQITFLLVHTWRDMGSRSFFYFTVYLCILGLITCKQGSTISTTASLWLFSVRLQCAKWAWKRLLSSYGLCLSSVLYLLISIAYNSYGCLSNHNIMYHNSYISTLRPGSSALSVLRYSMLLRMDIAIQAAPEHPSSA